MDDRELLELAAKAAGIDAHRGNGWQSEMLFVTVWRPDGLVTGREWNPLSDDGDALRLAVALSMDVCISDEKECPSSTVTVWCARFDDWLNCTELHSGDALAATRRAIVRAAAEIGKALPLNVRIQRTSQRSWRRSAAMKGSAS